MAVFHGSAAPNCAHRAASARAMSPSGRRSQKDNRMQYLLVSRDVRLTAARPRKVEKLDLLEFNDGCGMTRRPRTVDLNLM